MGKIIFLNGCSSAGKTAIAMALQHLSPKPWLLLGVDAFINMMPDKYIGFGEMAKEGCSFVNGHNEFGPTIECKNGPFGDVFFDSCVNMVKLVADQGYNLIVDEVLFGDSLLKKYVQTLSEHTVYFIQVSCDLKVMQEREILRRDRAIGLANHQFALTHGPTRAYDFTIDTTSTSSFTLAENILKFIAQNPAPKGFKKLEEIFE